MDDRANAKFNIKPTKLKTGMAVDLIGVNKWYGDFHVLRDINLDVAKAASAS
jgi:general L-amino acid transport system ATP-binding protein